MRAVNLESCGDSYALPNVNHVADQLGGCSIFSSADFSQSFHQLNYSPQSRPITAFIAYSGAR